MNAALKKVHEQFARLKKKYAAFIDQTKEKWVFARNDKLPLHLLDEDKPLLELLEKILVTYRTRTEFFLINTKSETVLWIDAVNQDKPYPIPRWELYIPQTGEVKKGEGWIELYQAGVIEEAIPLSKRRQNEEKVIHKFTVYETLSGEYDSSPTLLPSLHPVTEKVLKLEEGQYIGIFGNHTLKDDELFPVLGLVIAKIRTVGFAEKKLVIEQLPLVRSPVLYERWRDKGQKERVKQALLAYSPLI